MIVTTFPRAVRVIDHTLIPLKDGTALAARMWLPEDAEQNPVPAILEYLPYRKRDGTYERDALTHPYLAGHGYAGVRVDLRGSGESTGLLFDEYAKQEQDDGVEVIAWLAAQPWCNGSVGMMGISWGGFNGLQIAARRPPALKAIVTICSTDDRYADDAHYMGGTFLTKAGLEWAFFIFGLMCLPPDPALVGESDVVEALAERTAVPRQLAAAPATRCVLEARIGMRGLRSDPMPGLCCRWLDRRIQECNPASAYGTKGTSQGSHRAMGTWVPAFCASWAPDRIPPRDPALVGLLAEGRRYGCDG